MCQARLLQGEIEKIKHHDFVIKDADKLNGHFLLCACTTASTKVVVEAIEAISSSDIPEQKIGARLKSMERFSQDIAILSVQTPRSNRFRYLAGQSARLTLSNGKHTVLPIATCPCNERYLEFHLHRAQNDDFTRFLFDHAQFPLPVSVEGPVGWVEKISQRARPCVYVVIPI